MTASGRLPDFVVIGAMRSGTTSLYAWLDAQPELFMIPSKEPHFFSRDHLWARGLDWYTHQFAAAADGQLAGEASTSYSDPQYHEHAAERMATTIPTARLIYVVRHPLERLRSDLAHEIREGRETRPPTEAIADVAGGHTRRSCYDACLAPYFARFAEEQLLVVRFEDLIDPTGAGWRSVLTHLGLSYRAAPLTVHNTGKELPDAAPLMRWLRTKSWGRHVRSLPAPLRTSVKRVAARVFRRPYAPELDVPPEVAAVIWADVERLEHRLGLAAPLWAR